MTSKDCSLTPALARSNETLKLTIKGLGPVPSFKNHKRSVIRNGQAFPITDPGVKNWMEWAIESLVSQLRFASATDAGATPTGACPLCWIALSMPADDCWTVIPQITITSELCEPGNEGAEIVIFPVDSSPAV